VLSAVFWRTERSGDNGLRKRGGATEENYTANISSSVFFGTLPQGR